MAKIYHMMLANERRSAHSHPTYTRNDRHLFVYNLGVLLNQMDEGIVGAYLDDTEVVHVVYRDNQEYLVNVRGDNYMAIVKDVVKEL